MDTQTTLMDEVDDDAVLAVFANAVQGVCNDRRLGLATGVLDDAAALAADNNDLPVDAVLAEMKSRLGEELPQAFDIDETTRQIWQSLSAFEQQDVGDIEIQAAEGTKHAGKTMEEIAEEGDLAFLMDLKGKVDNLRAIKHIDQILANAVDEIEPVGLDHTLTFGKHQGEELGSLFNESSWDGYCTWMLENFDDIEDVALLKRLMIEIDEDAHPADLNHTSEITTHSTDKNDMDNDIEKDLDTIEAEAHETVDQIRQRVASEYDEDSILYTETSLFAFMTEGGVLQGYAIAEGNKEAAVKVAKLAGIDVSNVMQMSYDRYDDIQQGAIAVTGDSYEPDDPDGSYKFIMAVGYDLASSTVNGSMTEEVKAIERIGNEQ